MVTKTRPEAERLYAILKGKRALSSFIDYDPVFLKSLSDSDFIFLVNFLQEHYDSPGEKAYRGTTWAMRSDAMSGDCCINIDSIPESELPSTETENYYSEPFLFLKILPIKAKKVRKN